jgi:type VI secretion system protein ImpE
MIWGCDPAGWEIGRAADMLGRGFNMSATELYRAGKLNEAIQAIGVEVRDNPTDIKRRTFLFELLCFAGDFDRAEKHLNLLADSGPDAATGVLVYRAALNAERMRRELFEKKEYPLSGEAVPIHGTWNGVDFESIEDADPRVGQRLEIFAAGQCMWIPLAHVASLKMQPPKRLRDLLWAPVIILTGPAFKGTELGEVLLPTLSPGSYKHPDDAVKLGRVTVWEEQDGEPVPYGLKSLLVDGEPQPLLELRHVEIAQAPEAEHHAAAE